MKSYKVTLKKLQKLLAENLRERAPIQNIQLLFIQFQRRVVLAIVGTKLSAWEASSFCDFWKLTSCDFTLSNSFFTKANNFLDVLGKEYESQSIPNYDSF